MLPVVLLWISSSAGQMFEVQSTNKPAQTVPAPMLDVNTVSVCRVGVARPSWPTGPHLILNNGDRVACRVVGGDTRGVWVQTTFTGGNATDRLVVPFVAVSAVWFVSPPTDNMPDPDRYSWADGPKRTDSVLLTDGDVRRGVIETFTPEGVRLAKTSVLPTPRLAAVAFDQSLSRPRPTTGRRVRVVLTDGSRLTFAEASVDGDNLQGKWVGGVNVSIPGDQIVAFDVLGGPAVYLSDLKPTRQTLDGYTGLTWPPVTNRSVRGHPLRIGADTFDSGLGTHPRTVLTYTLGGKYRRFEAIVGPDTQSGRGGVAAIRILADNSDVTPDKLRELTTAVPVSLDVSRVKELTLEVDYGPFGGVAADVNWGGAKLVQ